MPVPVVREIFSAVVSFSTSVVARLYDSSQVRGGVAGPSCVRRESKSPAAVKSGRSRRRRRGRKKDVGIFISY
jgi:hypothetical protein